MSSDNAGLVDAGPGDDSGDIGDTDADIGILFQSLLAVTSVQRDPKKSRDPGIGLQSRSRDY